MWIALNVCVRVYCAYEYVCECMHMQMPVHVHVEAGGLMLAPFLYCFLLYLLRQFQTKPRAHRLARLAGQ